MSGPPVVITTSLGRPVTNVASLNGAFPMTVVDALGEPVTLVDRGGEPVTLLNPDGTLWGDLYRILALSPSLLIWPANGSGWQGTSGGDLSAIGQPVGLLTDLAALGGKTQAEWLASAPNIWTDAAFSNTGTTGTGTATISGGVITVTTVDASNFGVARLTFPADLNRSYVVTYTVTTISGINDHFHAWNIGTLGGSTTNQVAGTYTRTIHVTSSTARISLQTAGNAAGVFTVSNISVRELPGNHLRAGTWATPADSSRALYGRVPLTGRRNLLTRTEELDNAGWSKNAITVVANQYADSQASLTLDRILATTGSSGHYVQRNQTYTAAQHTLSFEARYDNHRWIAATTWDGTSNRNASFDLQNGVVGATSGGATSTIVDLGDGLYRCSVTYTPLGASGNFTIGPNNIDVAAIPTWNPTGTEAFGLGRIQLELGSTATAYQKVTDQYDVTEAGVADTYYIQGDAINDTYELLNPISIATAGTIVLAVQGSTVRGSNGQMLLGGGPQATDRSYIWDYVGGTTWLLRLTGEVAGLDAPNAGAITGLNDLTPHVITIVRSSATSFQLYFDGALAGSTTSSGTAAFVVRSIMGTYSGAYYSDAKYALTAVFPTALNANERAVVEQIAAATNSAVLA